MPKHLTRVSLDYLHSNSTSHTHPTSAFAEFCDNAYDAQAKTLSIEIESNSSTLNDKEILIISDDGYGMNHEDLKNCLNLGFSKTKKSARHAIGRYGNGFKSSFRRLGSKVLILSKKKESERTVVGFYSEELLRNLNLSTASDHQLQENSNNNNNNLAFYTAENLYDSDSMDLQKIVLNSFCFDVKFFQKRFTEWLEKVQQKSGTMIFIWDLDNCLNFEESQYDIQFSDKSVAKELKIDKYFTSYKKNTEIPEPKWNSRDSLRCYLKYLYFVPNMIIFLRNQRIPCQLPHKILSNKAIYEYKPKIGNGFNNNTSIRMILGIDQYNYFEDYGIMYFSKNRLVKSSVKIGCHKKLGNNLKVIGLVDVYSILEMNHSKTDFIENTGYQKLQISLAQKFDHYIQNTKIEMQVAIATDNDQPNNKSVTIYEFFQDFSKISDENKDEQTKFLNQIKEIPWTKSSSAGSKTIDKFFNAASELQNSREKKMMRNFAKRSVSPYKITEKLNLISQSPNKPKVNNIPLDLSQCPSQLVDNNNKNEEFYLSNYSMPAYKHQQTQLQAITQNVPTSPKRVDSKNSENLTTWEQCIKCAKWRNLNKKIADTSFATQNLANVHENFNCSDIGMICEMAQDRSVSDLNNLVFKHGIQSVKIKNLSSSKVSKNNKSGKVESSSSGVSSSEPNSRIGSTNEKHQSDIRNSSGQLFLGV